MRKNGETFYSDFQILRYEYINSYIYQNPNFLYKSQNFLKSVFFIGSSTLFMRKNSETFDSDFQILRYRHLGL